MVYSTQNTVLYTVSQNTHITLSVAVVCRSIMHIYRLCNSTTLIDSFPRVPNSPIARCARVKKCEPRRTKTKSTCIVKEVPSLLSTRRCCSGMSKGTQPSADNAAMLSVNEGAPRLYEPACEWGAGLGLRKVQKKVQTCTTVCVHAWPLARRGMVRKPARARDLCHARACWRSCAHVHAHATCVRKCHAMHACACVRSPGAAP